MSASIETISCACGEVQIELRGRPIASVSCYCDDCQAGSALLEALPGAPPFRTDAGTPYVHYRKDRIRTLRGAELLRPIKLTPASPTNRMVASCCNSAMLVTFDNALFWNPVFRARFTAPPPLEWCVNTRFAPPDAVLPAGIREAKTFPAAFVLRLAAAGVASLLKL
jgi:hypothetical protein